MDVYLQQSRYCVDFMLYRESHNLPRTEFSCKETSIVFAYSHGKSFVADNSFKFVLDIIRNKIMNKGCQARYVPVHLHEDMATVVPPCLQGTTYRIPEKVEDIIQRMYKVPMYTIEEQPILNTICLDQTCMESLQKAAASFLKLKHNDCDPANCVKVRFIGM